MLGDQSTETTQDGGRGASEAFGYTATVTGTATTIGVYLDSTDGVQLGLYSDKFTEPGVRLDKGSVTSNAAGWVTVPLSGGVQISRGTRYWIAIAATNDRRTVGYRDRGSSGSTLDYSGNGLANPYSISANWNSNSGERLRRRHNIYAPTTGSAREHRAASDHRYGAAG